MPFRNKVTPNLDLPKKNFANPPSYSWRGWCLKYVDDSVKAPSRKPTAKASYEQELKNGNITGEINAGVWVPGYLAFTKGAYVNYGHVFWYYRHADGRVEIHDSETRSGARAPYGSIAELLRWFGAYAPTFLGFTHGIDGVHITEWFEPPKPPEPPKPAPQPDVPTYTVKSGDTLGQIILDQGWSTPAGLWGPEGDVARVAKANGISDPNLIHPGQVIKKA